ncbi:MAG: tetratricopeptide (TPR) repeat protein [Pseudohongiellaceae bacterium]|jgi:tetratricopeptide (TPR) repeat protein
MSLLMDALRKAEEAKKKAAQKDASEEGAPVASGEKQQASAAVGKVSKDHSAPEIKLSMEAIEEVPKRSSVPNLKTPIEFEDEEDYVLPTSLGSATKSLDDSNAKSDQKLSSKNDPSIELEQKDPRVRNNVDSSADASERDLGQSPASPKAEPEKESKAVYEAFGLDSFENEEAAPDIPTAVVLGTKKPNATESSRVVVKVAEQARERARERDDPARKTARRVFAAKKSPLLKDVNMRVAVGGGLAVAIVVFFGYFYISLNRESTFNIPVGGYATTGFVDDGNSSETGGDQLSIDIVTVTSTEAEETAAISAAASTSEQMLITADVNISDASAAPSVAETLTEPPSIGLVAVAETSRSGTNLQPESIAQETPQPEAAATNIADTQAIIAESEVVVQSVASIGVQSAALVEPVNLISFRKQETVAMIDPNVDRAYAAYQQGFFDQAEALYRQGLASDPTQRDALLGLANITARNGNSTEALDLYSRLLARNPSDPIARAGLMELLPAGSPSEQEGELKRLLNDHPDVAALSYAYGNFLASNQRWSEAQQAYFRALQLAKSDAALNGLVNPDYAFNLAVSLEQLNQSEPAQNYYREALDYSANHPAGFDLTALRSRLANMAGNGNDE